MIKNFKQIEKKLKDILKKIEPYSNKKKYIYTPIFSKWKLDGLRFINNMRME